MPAGFIQPGARRRKKTLRRKEGALCSLCEISQKIPALNKAFCSFLPYIGYGN